MQSRAICRHRLTLLLLVGAPRSLCFLQTSCSAPGLERGRGRWPARPGCGVRGLDYSALAGEHSLHCGPPQPSAKTDARRALPLSLSSTRQQSDETLHVQWFGMLVENASGMSRMLCTRCVFLGCLFIFVLALNGCSRVHRAPPFRFTAAWSTEETISQSL